MTRIDRFLIAMPIGVILGLFLFCSMGCNLFDAHVKEFDLMRGMAADASQRLTDGSVAQMSVSGQALNPGIVVEAAIVYRALARYDGFGGQFSVASHGVLGPREFSEEIMRIINDSSLSDSERTQFLRDLFKLNLPTTQTGGVGDIPPAAGTTP